MTFANSSSSKIFTVCTEHMGKKRRFMFFFATQGGNIVLVANNRWNPSGKKRNKSILRALRKMDSETGSEHM